MLRLVSTITHAAESCGITNAEIESLRRIEFLALRKIKSMGGVDENKLEDRYMFIERAEHIFRRPMYTISLHMQVDAPLQISDESVMGPTALARLFVVLTQRQASDTSQPCATNHQPR
jgi:hypothetical protein